MMDPQDAFSMINGWSPIGAVETIHPIWEHWTDLERAQFIELLIDSGEFGCSIWIVLSMKLRADELREAHYS